MKALKCSCGFLECESFSWVSYVILIIMIEVIRTLNREKIWIKSLISKKAASSSQSCSSVCSHRLFKQSYLTTSLYHSPEGPECQYVCSCIPILESQDWHSHLWFIHGIPLRAPSLFAPFMVISPSALHSSCLSARYESEPAGYPSHPEWRPPVHRWDAEWWGVLGVQHPGAGGSNTQEVWRCGIKAARMRRKIAEVQRLTKVETLWMFSGFFPPLQTADVPRAEDLHQFWRVRVPELLGGHAALLAAADGGELPRLQLLPQLHARRRRAARHCLLPAQRESQG